MNFLFIAVKAHLADENETWHMSLVLKSFINNLFIMKSRDLSCDCLIGSTSRPYTKVGIHFVDTSWRIAYPCFLSSVHSVTFRELS